MGSCACYLKLRMGELWVSIQAKRIHEPNTELSLRYIEEEEEERKEQDQSRKRGHDCEAARSTLLVPRHSLRQTIFHYQKPERADCLDYFDQTFICAYFSQAEKVAVADSFEVSSV